MTQFSKRIFAAAGYTTVFMGPGRKEFDPQKLQKGFEEYIKEAADGTRALIPDPHFDEGVIGSFMAQRFIKQGNLPGFLPYVIPELKGKPCFAVEGACGTGGRIIGTAIRGLHAFNNKAVFALGFEMQNSVKSVYGADILAGAAYFKKERKEGHAFFFPGIFSERAGAYYKRFGEEKARKAMALWHEHAILSARKNPKAQEASNTDKDPFALGMTPPDPNRFLPYLNLYDCSKISDGAASIMLYTEEGLKESGIKGAIEIIAIGEAEGDITSEPDNPLFLETTATAVGKALKSAGLSLNDIGILEIHDCFTITALLALEAIGLARTGEASSYIMDGKHLKDGILPTNLSGGLSGFGHPTGATGIRQLVDLEMQLTGKAPNQAPLRTPYGMMISMGGNDKTVTCVIVKRL